MLLRPLRTQLSVCWVNGWFLCSGILEPIPLEIQEQGQGESLVSGLSCKYSLILQFSRAALSSRELSCRPLLPSPHPGELTAGSRAPCTDVLDGVGQLFICTYTSFCRGCQLPEDRGHIWLFSKSANPLHSFGFQSVNLLWP